ncbi:hypothetical protein ACWEKM_44070 [Streptomyces sp. NPDC004752]
MATVLAQDIGDGHRQLLLDGMADLGVGEVGARDEVVRDGGGHTVGVAARAPAEWKLSSSVKEGSS